MVPPLRWVVPIEFYWPAAMHSTRIETSVDMIQWDLLDLWPIPDEDYTTVEWPVTSGGRFFRWQN